MGNSSSKKPLGIVSDPNDTPIIDALTNKDEKQALNLITKENANDTNSDGISALMIAVAQNLTNASERLIYDGADVNYTVYVDGKTFNVLSYNVQYGYNFINIFDLINNGVNPNTMINDLTLLSVLVDRRRKEKNLDLLSMAGRLINLGANVNHRYHDGSTVLLNAVKCTEYSLVETLLREGYADPFVKDSFGRNILQIMDLMESSYSKKKLYRYIKDLQESLVQDYLLNQQDYEDFPDYLSKRKPRKTGLCLYLKPHILASIRGE